MSWIVGGYLASAAVSAVLVYVASERVGDARRPGTHRISLSLIAGMLWPVLLLGLVELGSAAAYAKTHEHHVPGLEVMA